MRGPLYKILDNPVVYGLSQKIFAPGAEYGISRCIEKILSGQEGKGPILDIGCGPQSWLARAGLAPVGLDINFKYMKAYQRRKNFGVVGSATSLPFPDDCLFGVWSIGLLHHLPDTLVVNTVSEAIRVCQPRGYCAILDAVMPVSIWKRPVAAFIRHLDRGEFMRSSEQLLSLLPKVVKWRTMRLTYAATGLEMLVNVVNK